MISAQASAEVTMEKIIKGQNFALDQPKYLEWVADFSKKSFGRTFLSEGALLRDQLKKDVKRSGAGKIDAIYEMMDEYTGMYDTISNAVAAVKLDNKHFLFKLPDQVQSCSVSDNKVNHVKSDLDRRYQLGELSALEYNALTMSDEVVNEYTEFLADEDLATFKSIRERAGLNAVSQKLPLKMC